MNTVINRELRLMNKKQYFGSVCLVILVFIVIGYFFTATVVSYAEKNEREHFLAKTQLVAEGLDVARVKGLRGTPEYEQSPNYKEVVASMKRFENAGHNLDAVGILGLKNDKLIVLADTLPPALHFPAGSIIKDTTPELVEIITEARPEWR